MVRSLLFESVGVLDGGRKGRKERKVGLWEMGPPPRAPAGCRPRENYAAAAA